MQFYKFSVITLLHGRGSLQSALLVVTGFSNQAYCTVISRVWLVTQQQVWWKIYWKKSPVLAKWNTAKPVKMNKTIEGLVDSKKWEPETSALWFRSICVADVAMEMPATFLSIFTVNPIWHVCNINLSDIFSASCSYIMHEAVSCDSSHLFHVHTDWHQRHNGSSHWVVWNGSYITGMAWVSTSAKLSEYSNPETTLHLFTAVHHFTMSPSINHWLEQLLLDLIISVVISAIC